LYGSIGTLIAIMVWIYLISLTLIIGFEVNIGLRSAKASTAQWKRKEKYNINQYTVLNIYKAVNQVLMHLVYNFGRLKRIWPKMQKLP
jgi:uncharacterized BrkB/YihY/UPF0761 family membrane protein